MGDNADVEGWMAYPQTLAPEGPNAYGYDVVAYSEQLEQDSSRLFVAGQDICLKFVEIGHQGRSERLLTKLEDFESYLNRLRPPGTITLILIPQEFFWGRLRITKECMLSLLTKFQVFPAFINVLRAFGQRTGVVDESYSGFYFQQAGEPNANECTYTVKYPEEHGRDGPNDPWSLRQMGVYHQVRHDSTSEFFVLHPSKSFLRRLKQIMGSREPITPWSIHMMALSAAMDKWRWYTSELERRFTEKKTKAQLSSMNEKGPAALWASITFEDTQDIHVLQDKLSQSIHYLDTNREVIQQVQLRRAAIAGKKDIPEDSFLSTLMIEATMELKRVESILRRAEGAQTLVRAILDFTCLESVRASSRKMTELTKISQGEAETLLRLTMKASRDTDTLKTLTLLTLIYLPASLVASIMDMNYISLRADGGKLSMKIKKEMWIFGLLVVVLLSITLGSYYMWLRKKRTQRFEDTRNTRENKLRSSW